MFDPQTNPRRMPPHNDEAEMALLGAILHNNRAYERVAEFLRAEHFASRVHGRIFEAIGRLLDRGRIADPMTLKQYFENSRDLTEIGGFEYLVRLAGAVGSIINAEDYGRVIHDLYRRRQLIDVGEAIVNDAHSDALDQTAETMLEQAERRLFGLAQTRTGESRTTTIEKALPAFLTGLQAAWDSTNDLTGITCGLQSLDRRTGGMRQGSLWILAARPSMGKTALALNIGLSAAAAGRRVFVASYEMSRDELLARLVATRSGIPTDSLTARGLNQRQRAAAEHAALTLASLPFAIDDHPPETVAGLRAAARRHQRQQGLELLIVDYLQLMHGEGRRGGSEGNRVQEISEITRGLKTLAKELQIPVLALSQLSRQVESREDKRPMLSDLRDSGSIEQDADVVMLIHRAEYYLERSEPQRRPDETAAKFSERRAAWADALSAAAGRASLIVAKNRQGRVGDIELAWSGARQQFTDIEAGE